MLIRFTYLFMKINIDTFSFFFFLKLFYHNFVKDESIIIRSSTLRRIRTLKISIHDHKFIINKFYYQLLKKKKKSSTFQSFYAIEIVRIVIYRISARSRHDVSSRFPMYEGNGWKITDCNASRSVIYRAVHRHDSFVR